MDDVEEKQNEIRRRERNVEEERRKSERAVGWKAPNCLLQHVMTSLLHINLSLLEAISVLMQ